jgi:hypothetical protein
MANGRCRIHGGMTPAGPASPHFKHGRYSKVLPARLLERYQAALDDPDLLAMHHEIGVVDARLHELIGRIDTGESGTRWKAIRRALQDYCDARGTIDEEARFGVLAETIEAGVSDEAAWREISGLIGQRQALVESERRRMVDLQQVITAGEAVALAAQLIDVVRRNVTDRKTLAAIGREFGALLARDDRRGLAPGGH